MDTVTVETSELIGPALDWAVAKCEGFSYTDKGGLNDFRSLRLYDRKNRPVSASVNWSQGGPIIEREDITVRPVFHAERTESGSDICRGDGWSAHVEPKAFWVTPRPKTGTTPLIAAMRCYVASKLGDTVQIPKEIVP